ncbi:hypothetical protein Tco_0267964 [Tanacetum coccineum]
MAGLIMSNQALSLAPCTQRSTREAGFCTNSSHKRSTYVSITDCQAGNPWEFIYRKYPLSKDVCQVMLKMKLLEGTMDEVCYQLLKMIEKQAGCDGEKTKEAIRTVKGVWHIQILKSLHKH